MSSTSAPDDGGAGGLFDRRRQRARLLSAEDDSDGEGEEAEIQGRMENKTISLSCITKQ